MRSHFHKQDTTYLLKSFPRQPGNRRILRPIDTCRYMYVANSSVLRGQSSGSSSSPSQDQSPRKSKSIWGGQEHTVASRLPWIKACATSRGDQRRGYQHRLVGCTQDRWKTRRNLGIDHLVADTSASMEDTGPIVISSRWRLMLEIAITVEIAWVSCKWLHDDLRNSSLRVEAAQQLALAWLGLCGLVQLLYIFARGLPRLGGMAISVLAYPLAAWSDYQRCRDVRDRMVNGLLYSPPAVIFATRPNTRVEEPFPALPSLGVLLSLPPSPRTTIPLLGINLQHRRRQHRLSVHRHRASHQPDPRADHTPECREDFAQDDEFDECDGEPELATKHAEKNVTSKRRARIVFSLSLLGIGEAAGGRGRYCDYPDMKTELQTAPEDEEPSRKAVAGMESQSRSLHLRLRFGVVLASGVKNQLSLHSFGIVAARCVLERFTPGRCGETKECKAAQRHSLDAGVPPKLGQSLCFALFRNPRRTKMLPKYSRPD
ncbi:unnamed protein product [Diplocarpon coronariae]